MSRRDYKAIADIVAGERARSTTILEQRRLDKLVLMLADLFASESRRDINGNSLFDRDRFYAACGMER
jgi:hypothetical protein